MTKFKRAFCKNCKKPVYRNTGRFNENLKFGWNFYCSRKCEYKYKTKRRKLTCGNCGKIFEREPSQISAYNYCSQSCAAKVNNRKYPKRKAELKTCVRCGKQFRKSTGNRKYCSMKCKGGRKPNHTSQELINMIKQKTQELQRIPSRREMRKLADSCRRAFGSWNNAIIAADLQPNRSHNQRMYKRVFTKASDGHICDSVSELLIDNWFIKNKIEHERNVSYPNTNHKADWGINFKGKTIFVEYFGLANDSPRYDRSVKEKKKLCGKHKISLIAIYPQNLYPKEFLEEGLKNKFKKFLVA